MSEIRENLIAAKALIDTAEKWGKGQQSFNPRYWSGKPLCAAGACNKITKSHGDYSAMHNALSSALPEDFKTGNSVDHEGEHLPCFNDHPQTTHADVMAMFDRAIAAQEHPPMTETAKLAHGAGSSHKTGMASAPLSRPTMKDEAALAASIMRITAKVEGLFGYLDMSQDGAKEAWADWCAEKEAAWSLSLSSLSPPTGGETYRHVKRGSEYELIGIGKVQAENWREHGLDASWPTSVDMREIAIYRSIDDGSLWARPLEEFMDGRFVVLTKKEGQ